MITRQTQMTLAWAFIGGTMAGSLAGWLLVPALLPVSYLTPVVLCGPLAGVLGGTAFTRLRQAPSTARR
jgi:hypothetical protein